MKARQIAPALTSVFAIDHQALVRFIERGPDGFWQHWQTADVRGKRIVHGGSVVATIGLDDRVSALVRSPDATWVTWDRSATELCVAHARGPLIFANDGTTVWHTWKPSPSAPWSEWVPVSGTVAHIDAAVLPGGHPVLFGLRSGEIVYRWQQAEGGGWTEWSGFEAPPGGASALRVTSPSGGGPAVFAVGQAGRLFHRWQMKLHGQWSAWEDLGGPVRGISVTKTPRGGLAVFAVGDDELVRYRFQPKPSGEWSAWLDLEEQATAVAAQISYTDGLEVFAIGLDGEVIHKWCERLDSPWTDWTPLDYEASPWRPTRVKPAPHSI